jgi:tRNA1(Val) A37 N6-methylase TrmN6
LSQIISSKIVDLLAGIVDSIPSDFMEDLSPENREELHTFMETMGIPLDYPNVVRKLTALLILNRLNFIIQNEKINSYMNLSIETLFSILEQKFSSVFISSILSIIATKSNFVIFPELFSYKSEFFKHPGNLFADLYEEVLKQKYRRKLGQFWTPDYISEFMIELILQKNPKNILDPCCGPGTFFQTLKRTNPDFKGETSELEIHPLLFEIATANSYPHNTSSNEYIYGDFLKRKIGQYANSIESPLAFSTPVSLDSYFDKKKTMGFDGIICNPPYSRHHALSSSLKKKAGHEIENTFGGKFNRISSLFVYFILKSMKYLVRGGRMVFITPTIAFESRNSSYLKKILKNHFCIPYIIVFDQSLSIFPGVDTAACIFVVEGIKPEKQSQTKLLIINQWVSAHDIMSNLLDDNTNSRKCEYGEVFFKDQSLLDPDTNWTSPRIFSRGEKNEKLVELSKYFRIMRGIATGNNSFFTFSETELKNRKIRKEFVVPTISKTRYIQKYKLSNEDFELMRKEGKKVWLLNLQRQSNEIEDENLLSYLKFGTETKVNEGILVRTRKEWYFTEKREIPYFMYTYLSRSNPRFILNQAKVRPLNTFLMLYPRTEAKLSKEDLILFWIILNSKITKKYLQDVGRSYGSDTLKIEPREMMKLLIINPFKLSDSIKKALLKKAKLMEDITDINSDLKIQIFDEINRILEIETNIP